MSDRDPGDKKAFAITKTGKYDLDKWNREYWQRFENLLRLASESHRYSNPLKAL